ncbi:hypothetical protein [Natrarchaeobius chitinivorans]|uniref:Uncharacterized protein n=1 Tax=Natrarchaeobius chitinivorans TaxID=1679083 RepID=A0A3N6LNQ8_NATCH|nr:hypothetical protein [Natrarchaeobius chitinivorans]RQG90993.1 hypothetical protein EA473_19570 [Natrarchaeobius chitinivorans]
MPTARRLRYVRWQLAWMLATILGFTVIGSFSLELFFVAALIGLLIVTELTAPFNVSPAWRDRLPWLVLVGLVAFAALLARRVLVVLPPEVLVT